MDNPFDGKRVYVSGRLGSYEEEPIVSRMVRLGVRLQGSLGDDADWLIVGAGGSHKVLDRYDRLRLGGSECLLLERDEIVAMLNGCRQLHYIETDWQRYWDERREILRMQAMSEGHGHYFLSALPNTGDDPLTIEKLYNMSRDERSEAFRQIAAQREELQRQEERRKRRREWLKTVALLVGLLLSFIIFGYDNVIDVLMGIGILVAIGYALWFFVKSVFG